MKKGIFSRVFLFIGALGLAVSAFAGVPLNSLDGAGGIAFNPLAHTSGLKLEDTRLVTKPQVGA